MRSTALLIDATLPWGYPALSLPRKEFMEHAIQMWEKLQFPALSLKAPWFGRSLGGWSKEEEAEAELAVKGEHFQTGERQAKERVPYSKMSEITKG